MFRELIVVSLRLKWRYCVRERDLELLQTRLLKSKERRTNEDEGGVGVGAKIRTELRDRQ